MQRKCLPDDSWEPADISSCTFKNTTRNPIYLLTTNVTMNSLENSTEEIDAIKTAIEKEVVFPNMSDVSFITYIQIRLIILGTFVVTIIMIILCFFSYTD